MHSFSAIWQLFRKCIQLCSKWERWKFSNSRAVCIPQSIVHFSHLFSGEFLKLCIGINGNIYYYKAIIWCINANAYILKPNHFNPIYFDRGQLLLCVFVALIRLVYNTIYVQADQKLPSPIWITRELTVEWWKQCVEHIQYDRAHKDSVWGHRWTQWGLWVRHSQWRPSPAGPWPSSWCRAPASESSTPRHA